MKRKAEKKGMDRSDLRGMKGLAGSNRKKKRRKEKVLMGQEKRGRKEVGGHLPKKETA